VSASTIERVRELAAQGHGSPAESESRIDRSLTLALLLVSCGPVVVESGAAGITSGSGGATTTSTNSTSGDGGSVPDAGSVAICDPMCGAYDGGACVCEWNAAPNCPEGWWKACCVPGTPCTYPFADAPHTSAEGPGPAPGWCSSVFVECHP